MKFAAKQTTDFAIVPAGNHVGICNGVIDLGLQPGSGMYPAPKPQAYIRFELPGEQIEYQKRSARPSAGSMSIGTTLTASMSEKANLRKLIESWFGKKFPNDDAAADFDMHNLLGKRCLLNVTHTEKGTKTYANISNATPLPKGMTSTEPQHNASGFFFDLLNGDDATFKALFEWLRKKITARLPEETETATPGNAAGAQDFDDDIPF